MKSLFLAVTLLVASFGVSQAQESAKVPAPHIYNPQADAQQDIKNAVSKANKEGKHVLLQLGGNWCVWCIRFNNLTTTDTTLNRLLKQNYEVVHVNYSPENKNEATLAQLGYPQRFGFPVFVVLDGKGNRIHTQNSAYLEEGKGHSPKLVAEFLQQWSPTATDPKSYVSKK
ncbi:thioredoxin family protein [Spirosoma sp. KUDC1026]|uniref:thioredoxin family protein n=1 Tax=Spirosoma sp. KUDC1026 TaxID=2745947 RepID=UPI00159B8563|nr:thioredoxin family protein [Spirosoma sp. KUDC1026]QKZ12489.1 thioredoxin family protein [Spirosoma sp. KUDC1026]